MDGGFKLGENDQKIIEWFRNLFKEMGDMYKDVTQKPLINPESIMGSRMRPINSQGQPSNATPPPPSAIQRFFQALGLDKSLQGGKKTMPAPTPYAPLAPAMPPTMSQPIKPAQMNPNDLMLQAYKNNLQKARTRSAPKVSSIQKVAETALMRKR